jgi:hypothetical protein
LAADSASGNLHRRYGRTLYLQKKEKQIRKPTVMIGSFYVRLPFSYKKITERNRKL